MNVMRHTRKMVLAGMLSVSALPGLLQAAETDQQSFQVKLTVTSSCDIHTASATDVDFGSHKSTAGTVTAQGGLTVNCTNGTPYDIGLNNGAHFASGTRNMKSAVDADLVAYTLWKDAARTQAWGDTLNSDTQQGTGTGQAQTLTVYGSTSLGGQSLKAGSYVDEVTATVTY